MFVFSFQLLKNNKMTTFSTTEDVTALWNDTDPGPSTEDPTQVSGLNFVDSFVQALSVMIVSELGDKTFFLSGKQPVEILAQ